MFARDIVEQIRNTNTKDAESTEHWLRVTQYRNQRCTNKL